MVTSTDPEIQEVDALLNKAKQQIDANAPSTLVVIVLDQSGSMKGVQQQTVDGLNQFIAEQRKEPGEAFVTLTLFDTQVPEPRWQAEPIGRFPTLTNKDYRPGGGTALLDAIGISIDRTEKWLADQTNPPGNIFVQIVTDGGENSSRDYTHDQIRTLIDRKTEEGWLFGYLGANQDAFAVAAQYGVSSAMTANYAGTQAGTKKAFANVSQVTSTLRSQTPVENTAWVEQLAASGQSAYGAKDLGDPETYDTALDKAEEEED